MFLILSTSLKEPSRSQILANEIMRRLEEQGEEVEMLDLSQIQLPMCDGDKCYQDPMVHEVAAKVEKAKGIIIASPIYNYDLNAAAKNFVELTGKAWSDTVVGFVCAAGGHSSYMSVMGFANSLMLDFRSLILPRFVYATGEAFRGPDLVDEKIQQRLDELTSSLICLGKALADK